MTRRRLSVLTFLMTRTRQLERQVSQFFSYSTSRRIEKLSTASKTSRSVGRIGSLKLRRVVCQASKFFSREPMTWRSLVGESIKLIPSASAGWTMGGRCEGSCIHSSYWFSGIDSTFSNLNIVNDGSPALAAGAGVPPGETFSSAPSLYRVEQRVFSKSNSICRDARWSSVMTAFLERNCVRNSAKHRN
jgi:hypothetical protein